MIVEGNMPEITKPEDMVIIEAPTQMRSMVEIPLDEFKELQLDIAEIKRLLHSPEDNKFMETSLRIGSLQNRLQEFVGDNVIIELR